MRIAALVLAVSCLLPGAGVAEILDNSFFIEEAYNQEPRVVQHIQAALWTWEDTGNGTVDRFAYSFTQEWPVAGQKHQLSYTVPYEHQGSEGDLGDVQIHYRYQALLDDRSDVALAPRLTLILPTGEGDQELGFQTNLPMSKRLSHVHIHLNAGATFIPGVRATFQSSGPPERFDLLAFNLGFSVIALLNERLNAMLETVTSVEDEIAGPGVKGETTRVLVSPGLRCAFDQTSGAQWVLGAAAPIGLSEDESDVGLFLYLSFEHPF